jgi:hypothetical protein
MELEGSADHHQSWPHRHRHRIYRPWGRPRRQPPPSAGRSTPTVVAMCGPEHRAPPSAALLVKPRRCGTQWPCHTPSPRMQARAENPNERAKREDPRRHRRRPGFARSWPVAAAREGRGGGGGDSGGLGFPPGRLTGAMREGREASL